MMFRLYLFLWALLLCWPAFAGAGPRIVVPARDISRGAVIEQSDLVFQPAAGSVQPGTVTAMKDIVGMEARRMLHSGESVREQDFRRPVLIVKGAIVTVTYQEPGVMLTATARAISAGGLGETITVQNPVSFLQVGAVVTGPGLVRAVGNGMTISSQDSSTDQ